MSNKQNETGRLVGGIEAGGTKFNCVIGTPSGEIKALETISTRAPEETLDEAKQFFLKAREEYGAIDGLGIASFGPVDLDRCSQTYGYILPTPKEHWSNTDLVGYFAEALEVPVAFETDVNGSAIGEQLYGAAKGLQHFAYVTIGTGLGAGIVSGGNLVQGIAHPEIGHISLLKHPRDSFGGCCPFHGHCLEGMASGTAIRERWQQPAQALPMDHEAWEIEAYYLAQMCVNITQFFAPERIILGGGVMAQSHLYPMIREQYASLTNGYASPRILGNLDAYIVAPGVADGLSGVMGCLAMADRVATAGA